MTPHERIRCICRLHAPSTVKVVLLALAHHADANGKCWPSQELIAEESGTTPRTVRRVLHLLHRVGMLTSSRRFNRSTIYVVEFNADTVSSLTGHSVRMNSTRTVQRHRKPPIQPCGRRHFPSKDPADCLACHAQRRKDDALNSKRLDVGGTIR